MRYIIADIHGCYREYRQLLQDIHFTDEDELYILGDAMDRGPEPIKVLRDIMQRPNAVYILGNHDAMALRVLSKLAVEITEENAEHHLTAEDIMDYNLWLQDGGETTARQFRKLSREDQKEILEFLEDALPYEILQARGKVYVLVHAGITGTEAVEDLDDYTTEELIWERADYSRPRFASPKLVLVTGHTPTPKIREDGQPLVYEQNGHLALDCGCVYGGNLAAYCLDIGETVYVKSNETE